MSMETPGRSSGRWAIRYVAPALLVLSAAGYLWLDADPGRPLTDRATATVRLETLSREVAATGVIRPEVGAEIDVGSRVSGIVVDIPVKVGDEVRPGDLLARLDPTEFQAGIDQAEADLMLAEARLETARSAEARARALGAEGVLSDSDLESARRDLEVARAGVALQQARLRSARISLGYTKILAPIRGVIADITTREGETVAASFASPRFVTIVDLERLEVQAYVDETDIGRVKVGQRAAFTVDTYPEAEFDAVVTDIKPKAELENGVVNYVVLLSFEPPADHILRPEMTAHVRLQLEERTGVLTLPRQAIFRERGGQFVQVRRADRWETVPVQAGWTTDTRVEIREGVDEGEIVSLERRQEP